MQKHQNKKGQKPKAKKATKAPEDNGKTYWQAFYQIHLLNKTSGRRTQTKAHGFFAIEAGVLPCEVLAKIVDAIRGEAKKCKSPYFDFIEVWSTRQMGFEKWEKKRKAMEEPRKPLAVISAEQLEVFPAEEVRTVVEGPGLKATPACTHGIAQGAFCEGCERDKGNVYCVDCLTWHAPVANNEEAEAINCQAHWCEHGIREGGIIECQKCKLQTEPAKEDAAQA